MQSHNEAIVHAVGLEHVTLAYHLQKHGYEKSLEELIETQRKQKEVQEQLKEIREEIEISKTDVEKIQQLAQQEKEELQKQQQVEQNDQKKQLTASKKKTLLVGISALGLGSLGTLGGQWVYTYIKNRFFS